MNESPDPPGRGLSALKLSLAATLVLVLLGWLGVQAYQDRRWVETRLATLGRMELAGEEIVRLDEVFTHSARLAVARDTPDPKAASRKFEPGLDQYIHEVLRLESGAEGVVAAMTASAALAAMEEHAFELLRQGEKAEAQRLLSSAEYAAQKEAYAKGMVAFNRNLRQDRDRARVEARAVVRRVVSQSLLVLVLLLFGVWWAVLVERRWRAAVEQNNRHLSQKAAELGELNSQLDRRVSERTKDVSESALASLNMMQDAVAAAVAVDLTNQRLQVANRSLRALSESSQAMAKAPDQQALLDRVCEILVTTGEYQLAWVGYAMNDEAHSVRPMARAGAGADYLDSISLSWADNEQGQGPTGTAIRTGRAAVCRTMACDPQFAPWRAQASLHGYLSSMALPLLDGQRVLGALNVYSADADAFDVDEQHLLEQLASDLAHGIVSWEAQTARREAEERARLTESKYAGLFEVTRDALTTIDPPHWGFSAGNPAAVRLFGAASEKHLLSLNPWDVSPEFQPDGRASAEKAKELIERAMREGSLQFEWTHRRVDGTEFLADILLTRMALPGQSGLHATVRDITERKRGQSDLHLRGAALTAAANAIVITDRNGTIEWVNPAFTNLTGYAFAEAVGRNPRNLLKSGKQSHAFYRDLWATITAGLAWRGEMTNRRKDGSRYHEGQTITPVLGPSGQITHFVAIKQDLTERDQAAAALQEANRGLESKVAERTAELKAALRTKDMFMANMSHELRTPLNAILGFTGALLMKLPGPINAQQEEQLNVVKASGRHLLSLINDLLDLAKIESGNMSMRSERVDCGEVLEDIAVALRPQAESKGLSLAFQAPEQKVHVSTDARAFKQIVLNLCNNAIKFTETGSVTVELKGPVGDQPVEIGVTDTGIGIRPEDRDKLFQVFSQMDSTRRDGTGLGLHLSQKLAHLINGKVHFTSDYGHGSRFWLTLPQE
jgi:PAS domain S-box-containing protein